MSYLHPLHDSKPPRKRCLLAYSSPRTILPGQVRYGCSSHIWWSKPHPRQMNFLLPTRCSATYFDSQQGLKVLHSLDKENVHLEYFHLCFMKETY